MLKKIALASLASTALGGCTPSPQYTPPDNEQAEEAYKALVGSQIAAWKMDEVSADIGSDGKVNSVSEMAAVVGTTAQLVRDLGTLQSLKSNLAGFVGIKMHECEWGGIDFGDAKKIDRPLDTAGIDYGYRCKIESFHRSSETPGLVLAYDRTAYFWKSRASYYYAEIGHGPARYAKDGELPK